jgi:hypothetical protein
MLVPAQKYPSSSSSIRKEKLVRTGSFNAVFVIVSFLPKVRHAQKSKKLTHRNLSNRNGLASHDEPGVVSFSATFVVSHFVPILISDRNEGCLQHDFLPSKRMAPCLEKIERILKYIVSFPMLESLSSRLGVKGNGQ